MARRSRGKETIEVGVIGEADFGRARKDSKRDLDAIEGDAKDTAQDIERAFDRVELSPELDTAEIRQAIDLARDLQGMVVDLDIDTDLDEIKQAERIARSLRAFQGRVDLSVEGRDELRDALGLAESMDQIRDVKVQVQGRQDLERAADLAADLDQTRKVRVEVDDSDIDQIDEALTDAGERGADGIADAIGGIDYENIGGAAVNQLTGALSAAGPWAAAGAAIGAVFADDLIGGINDQVGANRRALLGSLETGMSPAEVRRIGAEAGGAFSDGFGESLEDVRADALVLIDNLRDLPSAVDDSSLIRYGLTAKQVFGVDIPEQVEFTRRAIGSGLVSTVEESYQLMAASGQDFGLQSQENLEILAEYAPVFSRLKLQGVDALGAIGDAARDGVFENTDMAADSLKEMLARLDALDSSDALGNLGLDIQSIQSAIEQGRIDEVLATIADRLRDVTSESERTAIATEIFGTAIEGTEIDQFLEWLAAIGENAPRATQSLDEMADAVQDSAGPWTTLGRSIRDTTGAALEWFGIGQGRSGTVVGLLGLDETTGLEEAFDRLDRFVLHTRTSRDEAELLRAEILETFGIRVGNGLDEAIAELERLEEQERITGGEAKILRDSLFDSFETAESLRFDRLRAEVNDITDDFNLASGAVASLEAQFAELEGRFDSAQALRRIQEQSESLIGSVEDLQGELFTTGGIFERTDPAVRRFESTLEAMNADLVDAAKKFSEGSLSADEFRIIQRNTEEAIRRAGQAAGLTEAEIADLIQTYMRVPDRIETDISADTSQARAETQRFLQFAGSARATVTLDADDSFARNELNRFLRLANGSRATVPLAHRPVGGSSRSSNAAASSGTSRNVISVNARASGGPTTGLTLVGEKGPELLELGSARGFVHDATTTRRALASPSQSARLVLESSGSRVDDLLVEILREAISGRGGDVQAVLGSGVAI